MTEDLRRKILLSLGAVELDMESLLEYTFNMFKPHEDSQPRPVFNSTSRWDEMWSRVQSLCKTPPQLELFESIAGIIPIVYVKNNDDFERLMRDLVYKGRVMPNIEGVGAQFIFSKSLRFIILSGKPYSGIPASEMNLDDEEWTRLSMIIRKHHECTHYYTKQYFSSSRNNLHDELIADFCGIYAAIGSYRADWFMKFYDKRAGIYTKGLSENAAKVISALANRASKNVEEWSKTEDCAKMNEAERIEFIAKKELLEWGQGLNY